MDMLESAAKTSERMVVVGIKGDKNMANDKWLSAVGTFFGDRFCEAIIGAIEGRYGSLEEFTKKFPNVSIQAAEGKHGGGGNRKSTLDAVSRGIDEVAGRRQEGIHQVADAFQQPPSSTSAPTQEGSATQSSPAEID